MSGRLVSQGLCIERIEEELESFGVRVRKCHTAGFGLLGSRGEGRFEVLRVGVEKVFVDTEEDLLQLAPAPQCVREG